MPVSASEIEKLESSKRKVVRTRYTEEYRLEAVEYYRKAKEIDPEDAAAFPAHTQEENDFNTFFLQQGDKRIAGIKLRRKGFVRELLDLSDVLAERIR